MSGSTTFKVSYIDGEDAVYAWRAIDSQLVNGAKRAVLRAAMASTVEKPLWVPRATLGLVGLAATLLVASPLLWFGGKLIGVNYRAGYFLAAGGAAGLGAAALSPFAVRKLEAHLNAAERWPGRNDGEMKAFYQALKGKPTPSGSLEAQIKFPIYGFRSIRIPPAVMNQDEK